ncbi:hypothetical protein [Cryptosporangium aurantiacum]|uniref:Uncharacterized protein n=1 Tax=Cryptosporangium aurantiacum TaxID=134849 RepID=A0A1M7P805_9ACTN|nr:hypothetical protein [Cryptosporangium aurantiacum]SHN12866.1 hypothetical protein SAMN05443668_10345 [Cryptosporangium aurantiacum]
MTTYREVAATLIALGMLSPATAEEVLAYQSGPIDDPDEVLWAFEEFRVAFHLDAEQKAGSGIEAHERGYRDWLEYVAGTTRGAVVIEDVVLIRPDPGYAFLHFRTNGRTCWWNIEAEFLDSAYLDAMPLPNISDYEPGGDDPRQFAEIYRDGASTGYHVLVSDEQQRALARTYDLELRGRIAQPEPAPRKSVDAWLAEDSPAARAELPPPGEVDALERLILDRFPDQDAYRAAEDTPFVNAAARYLGEEFLRSAPSHWTTDLHPRWFTVALDDVPREFQPDGCPFRDLWWLVDDRRPGTLRAEVTRFRQYYDRYLRVVAELDRRLAGRDGEDD